MACCVYSFVAISFLEAIRVVDFAVFERIELWLVFRLMMMIQVRNWGLEVSCNWRLWTFCILKTLNKRFEEKVTNWRCSWSRTLLLILFIEFIDDVRNVILSDWIKFSRLYRPRALAHMVSIRTWYLTLHVTRRPFLKSIEIHFVNLQVWIDQNRLLWLFTTFMLKSVAIGIAEHAYPWRLYLEICYFLGGVHIIIWLVWINLSLLFIVKRYWISHFVFELVVYRLIRKAHDLSRGLL